MGLFGQSKANKENEALKAKIQELENMLSPEQQNIEKIQAEISRLQTNKNNLENEFRVLGSQYTQFQTDFSTKKGQVMQLDNLVSEISRLQNSKNDLEKEVADLSAQVEQHLKDIADKKACIVDLDDEVTLQEVSLYKPVFSFTKATEYQERLAVIREDQKRMISNGTFAILPPYFTLDGSAAKGKKLISDTAKLVVKCFNSECDSLVENVKFNNVDKSIERMRKVFNDINKLVKSFQMELSTAYLGLKIREITLAFEYAQKKQQEKEELRQAREELREQQKLEQEIRMARERIAKERKHFANAIKDLQLKADHADSDSRPEIEAKLAELQEKMVQLDAEEKTVDYREQNAKAGYVYVISNIGAFGENVFKIGMTRRLEPMDRVDELGDASVPFKFDVHALIFSDNAPELEAKLHQRFYKNRINKINDRKEFFKADIDEIEAVIKENYDKVVDIEKIPAAEQYRESLIIVD
ncbi:DUF4041 domain-containing protein [Acetanaerobacterium elongatum]|uniref:T5orf172 domain-containing protein n=1 Tax=Acetanaerobacterium elongatum TaxID=258515 RepID=A0A1G9Z041_9FIRM|nr:DUF4041 domain-containing protein [Acetanaerobacterium elongatum]SDN13976.1 T5orf172 domain-containing protein [Acetanaerobacterium elongatum]